MRASIAVSLVFFIFAVSVYAQTAEDFKNTPEMKRYIRRLKKVLPANTMLQLFSVFNDQSLPPMEKADRMYAIWSALPDDQRSKLPFPPAIEKLPPHIKQAMKDALIKPGLTPQQRHQQLREAARG